MGSYLAQPIKAKDIEEGQNQRFKFASVSMQGWRVTMEDAHICNLNFDGDDVSLFGVFDGHGGKEVAEYVSKVFSQELLNCQAYKQGQYKDALENTFLRMDEMIKSPEGSEQIGNQNAGCTANVILIVKDKIFCANSGDSRALISYNGTVKALSEDHKPQDEIEINRIRNAGGEVYQGRVNGNLNLSRALGDLDYKINKDPKNLDPKQFMITAFPDVTVTDLTPDVDTIIMGCDGIYETLSNQEIIDYFKNKTGELKDQAGQFLDYLLPPSTGQGTGCDNMSIILIKRV